MAIVVVDLSLKQRVEKEKDSFQKEIFGGRILLRKSHNYGAMLNLLEKHHSFVAGLSAGLTGGIAAAWLYVLRQKGMHLWKLALAFLVGGAFSNVYDRIQRGYVVDYFSFRTKRKKLERVVFNIGDLSIFLGALLVILKNFFRKS
jgi:signal peptidase II